MPLELFAHANRDEPGGAVISLKRSSAESMDFAHCHDSAKLNLIAPPVNQSPEAV